MNNQEFKEKKLNLFDDVFPPRYKGLIDSYREDFKAFLSTTIDQNLKQIEPRVRIEGALREIVRLTVIMSNGTSSKEYSKALSILYKEKILLRSELKALEHKGRL